MVKDGCFVVVKLFELDKYLLKMIVGLLDYVYNVVCICYLMVCVDWLCKCYFSDIFQCGDNCFVCVSWDEVFDMFYEELECVQKIYGLSVLLIVSGW